MIGKHENSRTCAFCGGALEAGLATIPFLLGKAVVVVRDVPAFICQECGEPFLAGRITDTVTARLDRLQSLGAEVSVITYVDATNEVLLPIE